MITMKAMIFAAGLGTRLKPYTDNRPKALVEIGGEPILKHVLLRLKSFGFREIVINVHHFADQLIDYLNTHPFKDLKIHISDERDCLLDTGGALKKAAPLLTGKNPILLHNVDVLSTIPLQSMLIEHATSGALATLAVSRRESSRKLLFDNNHQMLGWKNLETGEIRGKLPKSKNILELAFSGIHIIDPVLLHMLPGAKIFSIIDLYLTHCAKYPIHAFEHDPEEFLDIGKPEQLARAEKFLKQSHYLP